MEDTAFLTIGGIAERLRRREASARELVTSVLRRIEAVDTALNAFITVTAEHALARADEIDRELARGGRRGLLHGVPYAVKDVVATRGIPTTNGSHAARPAGADEDAAVVARLNEAGAVLVGKLNLWEFAMVGSVFGVVRNPWNAAYSASGSSGGSAAAVAAGLVPFAIGTDTGGSIRVPAAHCGVVGLRPTYGRVSRYGITPNAWSVDTVGPLTRSVADAATVFDAIAGADPRDPTTSTWPRPPHRRSAARAAIRIGLVKTFFDGAHPEVDRGVNDALREMERLGGRLVDVELPHAADAAHARTLHLAEAAAFHEARLRGAPDAFGPELRARLQAAQGFAAVDYIKALRLRTVLAEETAVAFRHCDALALPTDRGLPQWIGHPELGGNPPTTTATGGPNTFLASMAGIAAIALPCGFTREPAGLPISLMLQAPPGREDRLFDMGTRFQQVTDWHERRPPL